VEKTIKCTRKNGTYGGYVKTIAICGIFKCPSMFILYLSVISLNQRIIYNPLIEALIFVRVKGHV